MKRILLVPAVAGLGVITQLQILGQPITRKVVNDFLEKTYGVDSLCTEYEEAVNAAAAVTSLAAPVAADADPLNPLKNVYLDVAEKSEALGNLTAEISNLAQGDTPPDDPSTPHLSQAIQVTYQMKRITDASLKLREHITKVQLKEGGLTAPTHFNRYLKTTSENLKFIYKALHELAKKVDPKSVTEGDLVKGTNILTNLTLVSSPPGTRNGGDSAGVARVVVIIVVLALVIVAGLVFFLRKK